MEGRTDGQWKRGYVLDAREEIDVLMSERIKERERIVRNIGGNALLCGRWMLTC